MLENKIDRVVAQIANTIKEDGVLVLNIGRFHVSVCAKPLEPTEVFPPR